MLTLLTLPEVLKLTGLSRVRIWGRIKAGTFPASIKLSDERKPLYFRQSEVKKWVREYAAWKKHAAARRRVGTGPESRV